MYVIILVNDYAQATELNSALSAITQRNFKITAYSVGQQMVGLQHGGRRPTHVVDLIDNPPVDADYFVKWYNECVRPNTIRAETIGGDRYVNGLFR